jgi:hypothetical protein
VWVCWGFLGMEKDATSAGRPWSWKMQSDAAGWDRHALAIRGPTVVYVRARELGFWPFSWHCVPSKSRALSQSQSDKSCVFVTGCLHVHGSRGRLLAWSDGHQVLRSWSGLWTLDKERNKNTDTDTDTDSMARNLTGKSVHSALPESDCAVVYGGARGGPS